MTGNGSILVNLLLCGLMGLLGQGVRAAVGLKSAATLSGGVATQQSTFDAAYFGLSLMIGFIAGVLAGLGLDIATFNAADTKVLLGIAAAGYAGADFIENTFTRLLPGLGTAPSPPAAPTPAPASARVAPAPAPPAADSDAGGGIVGLAEALKVAAPKLNTTVWTPPLSAAFGKYAMTDHRQMAAAIGQFLVEAGAAFQERVENLNYTHAERLHDVFPNAFPTVAAAADYVGNPEKIANRVYANRLGNGDEASGDGYRFRGRGLIQLTGRTTYTQFAGSVGKTLDEVLAYCETPEGAAMSGCWYFSSHGCIPLAESWQLSEVTRRVNPAMLGNAQRIAYANAMLKALGG
jgi:predicted chitinase